ncbi:MAG: hypothetical protein JXQ27_02195 [Acidobacteria bacterium]|nr:hypothetical protein [Acidobacteriota bacterium]
MPPQSSGETPRSTIKLSYYDEHGAVRSYETEARTVIIGSAPQCHVVLPGIPAQACKIYLSRQGYYAMDLGGTLTIDSRPGSGFVAHGAVLQLGPQTGLRFQIRSAPASAAAPPARPTLRPAPPAPAPPTPAPARPAPVSPSASPSHVRPTPPPGGVVALAGSPHHPSLALTLGILLPGAGQAYNGQPLKAAILALVSALVLPWLYSLYDAWSRASRVQASGGRRGSGGWIWVILHLWYLLVAGLLTLIVLTLLGVLS